MPSTPVELCCCSSGCFGACVSASGFASAEYNLFGKAAIEPPRIFVACASDSGMERGRIWAAARGRGELELDSPRRAIEVVSCVRKLEAVALLQRSI
ncbi:hypothetical protein BDV18DRAFT_136908 [Aspergillus unguis]